MSRKCVKTGDMGRAMVREAESEKTLFWAWSRSCCNGTGQMPWLLRMGIRVKGGIRHYHIITTQRAHIATHGCSSSTHIHTNTVHTQSIYTHRGIHSGRHHALQHIHISHIFAMGAYTGVKIYDLRPYLLCDPWWIASVTSVRAAFVTDMLCAMLFLAQSTLYSLTLMINASLSSREGCERALGANCSNTCRREEEENWRTNLRALTSLITSARSM